MTRREWEPVEDSKDFAPAIAGPAQAIGGTQQPTGADNVVAGVAHLGVMESSQIFVPGRDSYNFWVNQDGRTFIAQAQLIVGLGPTPSEYPKVQIVATSTSASIQSYVKNGSTDFLNPATLTASAISTTSGRLQLSAPTDDSWSIPIIDLVSTNSTTGYIDISYGFGAVRVLTDRISVYSGYLALTDTTNGFLEFVEVGSAPSTPAANALRLYVLDKSGVSALYAKDDAGTEFELTNQTRLFSGLTADSADVNNSTTYVDSGLTVTLPAAGTYQFNLQLVYTTAAAADFKYKVTGTATVTAGDSYVIDEINGARGTFGGDVVLLGGALTDSVAARANGFLTVTAAGTVKVQFAQNTADVSNTHIDEGAYLIVNKVA